MSDRVNEIAWQVRKLMREAEAVTDESLIACAKLKQAMIAARQNPAFGVGSGHEAVLRLNRAEQSLAAAYGDLLRVHGGLNDIARETAGVDDGVPTIINPSRTTGVAVQPEAV